MKRGRFVDEKGDFIAWHEGYPFYTIGQRRGLGIHLNRPVFVKEINPEKNEVVLASLSALEKTEMWLKDWNLVNQERTLGHSDIIVKIRYRKQENHATITITPDHLLHVQLHEPLTAIAPDKLLHSIKMAYYWRRDNSQRPVISRHNLGTDYTDKHGKRINFIHVIRIIRAWKKLERCFETLSLYKQSL